MPGCQGTRHGGYQGFVTINDKQLDKIYLKGNERVVYFNETDISNNQKREYDYIWNSVYFRKYFSKNQELVFKKKLFDTKKKILNLASDPELDETIVF